MANKRAMGIIFANMHDGFLGELTSHRSLGAVPYGGRYRVIDFSLSNMTNAGIHDVGIITHSNYQSLMDHLGSGREWDLARKWGGLSILPPYAGTTLGFNSGRMESLAGVISYIKRTQAEFVVLSDCDMVANLDLSAIIEEHAQSGADVTIAYRKDYLTGEHKDSTTLVLDGAGRVREVLLNPTHAGTYNVYLNIAVMEKAFLENLVQEMASRNLRSFRRDVLQEGSKFMNIKAVEIHEPCLKIDSIRAYYDANMQMLDPKIRAALFTRDRPIYTRVRDEAPAKYGLNAAACNSLVADGAVIEGRVENCIIFRGAKVRRGSVVKNSVIMEGTIIGEQVSLDCVITDKRVRIQDGRTLMGFHTYPLYIPKESAI